MRRSVTIRKSGDSAPIQVRAGEAVLGVVAGLEQAGEGALRGRFTHRPAYADHAATFLALERARERGDADEATRLAGVVEAGGVEVWHTVHDMRIDEACSLVIAGGAATFRPTGAFLMLRTGGL